MKMVFPSLRYKEKAIEFIREFYAYGSEISGSGSLDRFLKEATYEQWLENVVSHMDIANLPETMAPSLTYFYVREEEDKIVGMINIRLALNEFLRREAGHIGYCIRPTERRKHYATAMLREGLRVCGVLGIEEVIVSCDKSNIASAKVIQNCGGVLEAEFYSEAFREVIQRYVIQQKKIPQP